MAGLDGIRKKIYLGDPFDENIYKSKKTGQLPGLLSESIEALESDRDFLIQGSVFSSEALDTYTDYKTRKEIDAMRIRPHPWKYHLYYDI